MNCWLFYGRNGRLCDQNKMCLLAYVTNIFGKLNELNMGMQGQNKHIMQMSDRVNGFRGKLAFWRDNLSKGNCAPFPQLCKFLTDNSIVDQSPTQRMTDHLKSLEEHFTTYFRGLDMSQFDWVIDPTIYCDAGSVDLLIELSCDQMLQRLHSRVSVEEFWFGTRGDYPEVALCALKLMVPFTSTYLCEAGFSALVCMKSKY